MILIPAKVDADEKNINRLLNNQAVVSRQIMCILEKSPCDQLGKQLKGIFTIVLNNCAIFFFNRLQETWQSQAAQRAVVRPSD